MTVRVLSWVLKALPPRAKDWLAGVAVDVLWRSAAREQRRAHKQNGERGGRAA